MTFLRAYLTVIWRDIMDNELLKELLGSMIDDAQHTSISAALALLLAANPQLDRIEARDQVTRQERSHFATLRAKLDEAFGGE